MIFDELVEEGEELFHMWINDKREKNSEESGEKKVVEKA